MTGNPATAQVHPPLPITIHDMRLVRWCCKTGSDDEIERGLDVHTHSATIITLTQDGDDYIVTTAAEAIFN